MLCCWLRWRDEALVKPGPVTDYVITPHSRLEMKRRGLKEETVRRVLSAPEQRMEVRPGRVVLQSRLPLGAPARPSLPIWVRQ